MIKIIMTVVNIVIEFMIFKFIFFIFFVKKKAILLDGFKLLFLFIPSLLAVINNHYFNNRCYNRCVSHLGRKCKVSFL